MNARRKPELKTPLFEPRPLDRVLLATAADRAELQAKIDTYVRDLAPETDRELDVVHTVAVFQWRADRFGLVETGLVELAFCEQTGQPVPVSDAIRLALRFTEYMEAKYKEEAHPLEACLGCLNGCQNQADLGLRYYYQIKENRPGSVVRMPKSRCKRK